MRLSHLSVLMMVLLCTSSSCKAGKGSFAEQFEKGNKEAYANRSVQLKSGRWAFDDALIGHSEADKKNGSGSARIRNTGSVTMEFDISEPIEQLTLLHATYGGDGEAMWQLQYSDSKGADWKKISPDITSNSIINKASFHLNHTGPVRFRIKKLGGGRLNIDDIQTGESDVAITLETAKPKRDNNMALGNPSGADKKQKNNYLLEKLQFAMSYNNGNGTPNWVSWHLNSSWKGNEPRCNCFAPDSDLPEGYYRASPAKYISSGFDRGHMCPSGDRDGSMQDNSATFAMSNIAPQAPNLNRDVWEKLESYSRQLIGRGNELYIISGAYGSGGTGEKGRKNKIGNYINVPARFWKVIVVLPEGGNDISRVNAKTRIIAVDMPNDQAVNLYNWAHYRTSVDAIEQATGYDLLSNVPTTIQTDIESRVDAGPTH